MESSSALLAILSVMVVQALLIHSAVVAQMLTILLLVATNALQPAHLVLMLMIIASAVLVMHSVMVALALPLQTAQFVQRNQYFKRQEN